MTSAMILTSVRAGWYVFTLEQEEYVREGVPCESVEFQDNAPVLQLLEGPVRSHSFLHRHRMPAVKILATMID